MVNFFYYNDAPTTEIYTLSLHDALPISRTAAHRASLAAGQSGVADSPTQHPRRLPLPIRVLQLRRARPKCLGLIDVARRELRGRNWRGRMKRGDPHCPTRSDYS